MICRTAQQNCGINHATPFNFFTANVGYVYLLSDLKHFACSIVFNQDSQLVVDCQLQYYCRTSPTISYSKAVGDALDQMIYLRSRASVRVVDIYYIRSDFALHIILSFAVLHYLLNPNKILCIKSPID